MYVAHLTLVRIESINLPESHYYPSIYAGCILSYHLETQDLLWLLFKVMLECQHFHRATTICPSQFKKKDVTAKLEQ